MLTIRKGAVPRIKDFLEIPPTLVHESRRTTYWHANRKGKWSDFFLMDDVIEMPIQ